MDKGILTVQQEDFLIELIMKNVQFPKLDNKLYNWLLKKFKRKIITAIVRGADDMGLDRLGLSLKLELQPIVTAAMEKRYEDIDELVAALASKEINLKKADEKEKLALFGSTANAIAKWIAYIVKK